VLQVREEVFMMTRTLSVLADGFAFLEGPRWRAGKLWVSDMHDDRVLSIDLTGRCETVAEVPGRPSGLGWLPDGRLLIVSMTDRRLLRLGPGGLTTVADLSGIATFHCNDMVVDAHGRAYVGNFGFDFEAGVPPVNAALALVLPDGSVRAAADGLAFPNGTVITPDGRTLIVAESFAARLTAFDIAADGSLGCRRVWASLAGAVPDGICLDAGGAVWVASPLSKEVLRIREGGGVIERIPTAAQAIACMLGGPTRRTLFVLTSGSLRRDDCRGQRTARVECTDVEVAGAGWP
jgi:sugar lactone lactonase YvrE